MTAVPDVAASVGRRLTGLHAQLVDTLGAWIVGGEATDDGTLVADDIGRRFGLSRSVVREALRALESKGILSSRPRVGIRMRPASEWNLFDPDVIDWRVRGRDPRALMREFAEVRAAVEPYAARLAADRADDEDRARIREAADAMTAAADRDDTAAFTAADTRLHTAVLRGTHNPMLQHLAISVAAILGARAEWLHEIAPESVAAHNAVATAIERRDPAAAEAAMHRIVSEMVRDVAAELDAGQR